ncbi:MAG: hypothetical protein R3C40_00965 [Parvularculaceae bacterium]
MRKLIFGGLFAGAASLFPITAGAEPFSAYWSSLSIAEKSLVDRIAEDLFSEQEMQDPGWPTPSALCPRSRRTFAPALRRNWALTQR